MFERMSKNHWLIEITAILAPAVDQVMKEFQVESDLLESFVVSIYTLAVSLATCN